MGDSPLEGRVVVVTGAARGVGAALARELDRRGARLALLDHDGPALERTAAALPNAALALDVDVSDYAALSEAAKTVRSRLGRPSVVVANAGIAEGGPFALTEPATWRRVIDVNLTGSAQTARAFLPDLVATAGYHLQIASLAAIGAVPMMSAYCASKAGVEAFTHALRAGVAHQGVAVGIAYLNWTGTDMIRDADRFPALSELRGHMPALTRRVSRVEVVAERLARAVESRSTAVYLPAWLRLVQAARAAVPPVVLRVSRRELSRLPGGEPLRSSGLLGAGGRADRAATRRRTGSRPE